MKRFPFHLPPHANSHVCCMCVWKSPLPLMEVWSAGNWHPICRDCLREVELAVFSPLTSGRLRGHRSQCEGQTALSVSVGGKEVTQL